MKHNEKLKVKIKSLMVKIPVHLHNVTIRLYICGGLVCVIFLNEIYFCSKRNSHFILLKIKFLKLVATCGYGKAHKKIVQYRLKYFLVTYLWFHKVEIWEIGWDEHLEKEQN